MYGGLGMSAPSLHRESTDSLINEVGCRENTTPGTVDTTRQISGHATITAWTSVACFQSYFAGFFVSPVFDTVSSLHIHFILILV